MGAVRGDASWRSTGSPSERVDVAIVGGGHNALVAAAYLARAGLGCIVFERRERFGGAAVSEPLFAGRDARLSSYSYLVSLLPERIVRELSLRVQLVSRRVSSYTPDPRADCERGLLVDPHDELATRSTFAALGADLADWRDFYSMTARAARALFGTLLEPLRSREQLRAQLGDQRAWETLFERPLGETVAERFGDELVRGVVLSDALIGTFAHPDAPDLRANRCFLYHVIGRGSGEWLVPLGGMGSLSGELERAAREAGAELRASCEVLALEPDGDGCTVRHERGAVHAQRVLVGAAPAEMARLLGEPAPGPAPEGAQLKVNLLLSRLPALRDGAVSPQRAFAGTFHVNESAPQLRDAYACAEAGELPEPVPCEAYCHSLTDPSILGPQLRAAGAQTLTVFALQLPARLFATDARSAGQRALQATLRSLESVLAEPLLDCVMRDASGEPCIEVRTPLDLERELRMPGGHIFHRDLAWPYAEREEEVGRWGVETAHRSILLCGAGARRGGGVSGIPGRNAAIAVLGARAGASAR
ncbi:MAG TPA: NAD(P)/FAD-dependent oxidoreductase [Solirubrobacteraceae bacterium]